MINTSQLDNARRFLKSSNILYLDKDYTSATILLFKALFGFIDHILLINEGKVPKDHTERFRMIDKKYPDIYLILDKYFKIYQDTYSLQINKETYDVINKNVEKIIEKYQI